MSFPLHRLRRLRTGENLRSLVRETRLSIKDMVYPLFVIYGSNKKIPVDSMPGVWQFSVDRLDEEINEIKDLGIPAVLLFGLPEYKDAQGTSAYQENGVIPQAISRIKALAPELVVVTDVCLCEYTDHGHCGILDPTGRVDNDTTLDVLAREALVHVQAGADIVAPSDMMDGRIGFIRRYLDNYGYDQAVIMSYAAKYCSAFYGPFREAADSAPQFGDRKTYQMDYANVREALCEVSLDIEEGADIVMVKPALAYLDVIKMIKDTFTVPTAAYSVSGEYAMVKAAAAQGWLDETRVVLEMLTGIKRAGADIIITYAAKDAARWLKANGY